MVVALGSDHGGVVLREAVLRAIGDAGAEVLDFGSNGAESVDYPDYAYLVARAVAEGKAQKGVLLCGTGIGMSIAANKVKGIRCGHVADLFSAKATAEHNDANIIAMGGRISSPELAYEMTYAFLTTPFAGGRHARRVEKIAAIERGEDPRGGKA